jgi:hypothetical protein
MTNLKVAIIGIWNAEQSNAELEKMRETNLRKFNSYVM